MYVCYSFISKDLHPQYNIWLWLKEGSLHLQSKSIEWSGNILQVFAGCVLKLWVTQLGVLRTLKIPSAYNPDVVHASAIPISRR